MNPIHRVAAFLEERLSIKPAVSIPFLTGVILLVVNWAVAGEPFDVNEFRAVLYAFILTAAGVLSPPATDRTLAEVSKYH